MREALEKLVSAGRIGRQNVEPLLQLAECGYCKHRSWGFGKISAMDTVLSRITIDFSSRPGHSMDLAFAAESLDPIKRDHILVRKVVDLPALRHLAAINHLELIKLVLESLGGTASAEQIQQILSPDVITADWKKWWDVAKRELKKDGHFQVPLKKNAPIVYTAQEVSLQDRLMASFRDAKGLKARVARASELHRNMVDLNDPQSASSEVIPMLNSEIASHQRTMPALALEAVFVRDELRQAAGQPPQEGEITAADIWAQDIAVGQVVEQMPTAQHKQALQSFQQANPSQWVQVLLDSLNSLSARFCSEAVNLLVQNGQLDALKEMLAKLINRHLASSDLLLWLAKERSDVFADILGPEVFRAMLTAIERDQFNEVKSNRLRDFVVDDQGLLVDLIASADLDVIRDLTRSLQLSTSFDDMDKRSLLARIVKHFPAIKPLISGEQHARQESALLVSWASLEKRKQEYTELVHKKIPANSREIAIARSYGDLSENHEYKAAKEMQKLLMRRKAELENALARAQGNDFLNADISVVGIGTRVNLTNLDTQQAETYTILGAWDFNETKGIVSYLSPIAQSLLNRKPLDEVEFVADGSMKRYRIDAIGAYRPEQLPRHEQAAVSEQSQTGAQQTN